MTRQRNSPAIRTTVPVVAYGSQCPKEKARSYAFAFGNAGDELRRRAYEVAKYLGLPRSVIVLTWETIDSMRRSCVKATA